jgi:hypothetical protein
MATWLQKGMLDTVIGDALLNPRTLLQDSALSMSCALDFGQVDLSTQQDISDDDKKQLQVWTSLQPNVEVCSLVQCTLLHHGLLVARVQHVVATCFDECAVQLPTLRQTLIPVSSLHMCCCCEQPHLCQAPVCMCGSLTQECAAALHIPARGLKALAVQMSRQMMALQAWLADAGAVFARQVVLKNCESRPLQLLGLSLQQNWCNYFAVLDDHNLWSQHRGDMAEGIAKFVTLQAGESARHCLLLLPCMHARVHSHRSHLLNITQ